MSDASVTAFYAVCAPGLAPLCLDELGALGIAGIADPGGVSFQGGLRELYRANIHLRTATRVLVRVDSFAARGFAELERKARRLPWQDWVNPGEGLSFRVTCQKSKLYHEGAVAERLREAAERSLGETNCGDGEAAGGSQWVVRVFRDRCTISLDSSGERLQRRGYRLALAKAPLRETLAAGILLASGWSPEHSLADPFCGSGTLCIEAALISRGIPPGLARPDHGARDFAFLHWPGSDTSTFSDEVSRAQEVVRARGRAPVLGQDADAGAIRMARENAARAGVAGDIDFLERRVSAADPAPQVRWIVTNPPYGLRVDRGAHTGDAWGALQAWSDPGPHPRLDIAALALEPSSGRGRDASVPTLPRGALPVLRTRNGGLAVTLFSTGPGASAAIR